MWIQYLFFLLFAVAIINMVYRYFKFGRSMPGLFLGGTVIKELGEIKLSGRMASSQTLKVSELEGKDGERFLGLCVVSKAPLAVSMVPYRLSKSEARELATMLNSVP